jgi:FSR family fosmidomycin resistance protein-like MFS transporter
MTTTSANPQPQARRSRDSTPTRLRTRIGVLLVSHTTVDVYSAFLPPLLGLLEVRCRLSPQQTALLLGVGSLSSGLSQPLAAWLSDRIDSRWFGALGLLLAAVCLSCLGMPRDFPTLLAVYVTGMIGVGMFHPVGASSAGQLADGLPGARRSLGLGLFFVFGMAGGTIGSMLAPRVAAQPDGFMLLRYAMLPGLLLAGALQLSIGRVAHRVADHASLAVGAAEIRTRWRLVGLLYVANALRFTVNITLFYLYVRWAQASFAADHPGWTDRQVADAAAATNGNLIAATVVGMAIGGLVAGAVVRPGREKWPLVVVPLLGAPFVAIFPMAGIQAGYLLAVLAGIGFAAMIPVTMSVAQRLLPHRTSLASGMMLGGAWAVAVVGPVIAERCLEAPAIGLDRRFGLTAVLLALSGIVCLPLRRAVLAGPAARRS